MALQEFELEAELAQGDILDGLILYTTDTDGNPSTRQESSLGLILSRNCNARWGETLLVAEIRPYRSETFTKIDAPTKREVNGRLISTHPSLEQLRRRFHGLRDGATEPDQLYLGTLPNKKGRFAARLDAIFTIELPAQNPQRIKWVTERRVGRLSGDYRRHLHARLFSAIAREGFDDLGWWCEGDLEMMTIAGRRELRAAEEQRDDLKMKVQQSVDDKPKAVERREKSLATLEKNITARREALALYEEQWSRKFGDKPKGEDV